MKCRFDEVHYEYLMEHEQLKQAHKNDLALLKKEHAECTRELEMYRYYAVFQIEFFEK